MSALPLKHGPHKFPIFQLPTILTSLVWLKILKLEICFVYKFLWNLTVFMNHRELRKDWNLLGIESASLSEKSTSLLNVLWWFWCFLWTFDVFVMVWMFFSFNINLSWMFWLLLMQYWITFEALNWILFNFITCTKYFEWFVRN